MNFKAGDKVKCIDAYLAEKYFTVGESYIIDEVPYEDHVCFRNAGDIAWQSDRFELIGKEITVKEIKQFNPQPGDKIICNNGEEFTCCTKEFLFSKGVLCSLDSGIYSYRVNPENNHTNIIWMYWSLDGKPLSGCKEWDIREVIPKQKDKSGTNSFDKNDATEEGYMELRHNQNGTISALNVYTAEDIRNAWDDLGWWEDHLKIFKKSLDKVTSSEYNEYLRLKAMFESARE